MLLTVVHESSELLVINKPAGLVCHPTKGDCYSSLISRVRLHLGESCEPHLINRLDRETSGVVLVAKTAPAALELRRLWESREVFKSYLAIVHGYLAADSGTVRAPLGKDQRSPVAIKDCVQPGGADSQTEFVVLNRFQRGDRPFSLLRVRLLTGRKHQIRIHLAHIGHSIVGDKLYGGDEQIYLSFVQNRLSDSQRAVLLLDNQALHAEFLRFRYQGETVTFSAAPEPPFLQFAGSALPLPIPA